LATIGDVARHAGVSPVTVSRVINGGRNVKQATRERVFQAINDLNYVPSGVARSLRSKRTNALALLVPDITNPFWTTVSRGVEDAAQNGDYSVLLCNTDEEPEKLLRYLDVILSQRVDGAIVTPYDSNADNLSRLRERKIPTVIIDRRIDGWEVDTISGDSISGARELVRHLIHLGHHRIAVISGPMTTSSAEDRVIGYILALVEAGLPVDQRLIKRGEFRSSSGEELAYRVLDEGINPTAIFATNNTIAMGVIKAVEQRGLRIPLDIALVCFDDFPNLSRVFPFLTVAVQPAYDMGVRAAELLLNRLSNSNNLPPRHIVFPTRMVIRYSCGSKLKQLCFPLPNVSTEEGILVEPIKPEERGELSRQVRSLILSADN
jgi:LacI family transcriptional regulator